MKTLNPLVGYRRSADSAESRELIASAQLSGFSSNARIGQKTEITLGHTTGGDVRPKHQTGLRRPPDCGICLRSPC